MPLRDREDPDGKGTRRDKNGNVDRVNGRNTRVVTAQDR